MTQQERAKQQQQLLPRQEGDHGEGYELNEEGEQQGATLERTQQLHPTVKVQSPPDWIIRRKEINAHMGKQVGEGKVLPAFCH